jgi:riboflavin kinase
MALTEAPSVGHDELATLKQLALDGALSGDEKISCAGLAEPLDASTQTASRRLQRLDEADYLDREIVSDGQWVTITAAGESALQQEYADYCRIFEQDLGVELHGLVTSGMGEGRHYISLPGYMEQFVHRLDYEPFPGTLNVDLTEESIRRRARLNAIEPIVIEGWEDDERTYGPAYCYTASITHEGKIYEPAHVITPERTHHGEDQLEVIAPDKLRDELDLADDSEVMVRVTE